MDFQTLQSQEWWQSSQLPHRTFQKCVNVWNSENPIPYQSRPLQRKLSEENRVIFENDPTFENNLKEAIEQPKPRKNYVSEQNLLDMDEINYEHLQNEKELDHLDIIQQIQDDLKLEIEPLEFIEDYERENLHDNEAIDPLFNVEEQEEIGNELMDELDYQIRDSESDRLNNQPPILESSPLKTISIQNNDKKNESLFIFDEPEILKTDNNIFNKQDNIQFQQSIIKQEQNTQQLNILDSIFFDNDNNLQKNDQNQMFQNIPNIQKNKQDLDTIQEQKDQIYKLTQELQNQMSINQQFNKQSENLQNKNTTSQQQNIYQISKQYQKDEQRAFKINKMDLFISMQQIINKLDSLQKDVDIIKQKLFEEK